MSRIDIKLVLVESITLNAMHFRFLEKLDNGDEVITYFDLVEKNDKVYYVWEHNSEEHGPFDTVDDAIEGARIALENASLPNTKDTDGL